MIKLELHLTELQEELNEVKPSLHLVMVVVVQSFTFLGGWKKKGESRGYDIMVVVVGNHKQTFTPLGG